MIIKHEENSVFLSLKLNFRQEKLSELKDSLFLFCLKQKSNKAYVAREHIVYLMVSDDSGHRIVYPVKYR